MDPMTPYNGTAEPGTPPSALMIPSAATGEITLAELQKMAAEAPLKKAAVDKILISNTYAADWTNFGAKNELGSAGAERVGRWFPIEIEDVSWRKETFENAGQSGYRYVFEGYGRMGPRRTYGQGIYSTREEFLGKSGDAWRATDEINENDIRMAAYHRLTGNLIKAFLGIRAIPQDEFETIMTAAGQDPAAASKATFGQGSQGGTDAADGDRQRELGKLLIDLAHAGYCIACDEQGRNRLETLSDIADPLTAAKASCLALTTFMGKDGLVQGIESVKRLKGRRLEYSLKDARAIVEAIENKEE